MRTRIHRSQAVLVGLLLVAVVIGGCAQSSPCLIIPAQIELAQSKRDQAKVAYERKLADVDRSLNNFEVSNSRLDRLIEERDQLRALLGEEEGGSK